MADIGRDIARFIIDVLYHLPSYEVTVQPKEGNFHPMDFKSKGIVARILVSPSLIKKRDKSIPETIARVIQTTVRARYV